MANFNCLCLYFERIRLGSRTSISSLTKENECTYLTTTLKFEMNVTKQINGEYRLLGLEPANNQTG